MQESQVILVVSHRSKRWPTRSTYLIHVTTKKTSLDLCFHGLCPWAAIKQWSPDWKRTSLWDDWRKLTVHLIMRNTFLRLLAIYYQVQLPLRKDMDVMNRILPSHELPPPKESNQFLDPSVRSPRLFWISFFSDVGLRSTPCMKESISCLCASCSTRLEGGSGSDIFGTVQESKECRDTVSMVSILDSKVLKQEFSWKRGTGSTSKVSLVSETFLWSQGFP